MQARQPALYGRGSLKRSPAMTSNTPPGTFVSPGSVLPDGCNKDIVAGYVYRLWAQTVL